MAVARKAPGLELVASFWFAIAVLISAQQILPGESGPTERPGRPNARELSSRFPDKPSIPPSWSIPVEALGFSAPGQNFLGQRMTLASLDFLGEGRILFTFRVPGLMKREPGSTSEDQRQIRAVVMTLPSGALQAETNWTLHDRSPYIAMLDDDHFLLRDQNTIYEIDSTLNRKPLLQFPGPVLNVKLPPGDQYIVANSHEPSPPAAGAKGVAQEDHAASSDGADETGSQRDIILRILDRASKKVLLVSRLRNAIDLPLNNDGFLTIQHSDGNDWSVDLNTFTGQSRTITRVKSTCAPDFDFLTNKEALVTACSDSGDNALMVINMDGQTLWTDLINDHLVWPKITIARSGLRFARASLYVSHSINAFDSLGRDDIKGQWVQVFDSASGNVAFETSVSPVLDGGGNVAISPSGRRVAVLNGGAIQVFELPAPPPLPRSNASQP